MIRHFLVILGLLLCLNVEAATKYVRPSTDCTFSGDGTAYACAASGGAAGAWRTFTPSGIQTVGAGDTVKTCGNFTTADVDTGTAMLQGTFTNAGVKVDGDCSADGGSSRSIWNGGGTHARGFDSGASGAASVEIRNIDFTGFTAYAILGQGTGSDNWIIEDISCDGYVTTNQCIAQGSGETGWSVIDSTFTNCYNDCISANSPMTLTRLTGRKWSTGTVTGDFVESISDDCDGWVITDLDLQSTKDIKQAIILNSCTGAVNVTLTGGRFVKIGQSTDTSLGLVNLFFDGPSGTVTVKRVYASGGRINLFVSGGASLNVESSVFGPATNTNIHCGTSTPSCIVQNNTINGAGASSAALEMQAPGAGALAVNNAIVGTRGINRGASGVETNNTIIATTPCYVSGSPGSCDASDDTDNLTMGWVGGASPPSAAGYKLAAASPLRRACKDLNLGNIQDNGNRAFSHPSSCGAWEATSGDLITNNTRTTASTRTNRN